MDWLNFSGEHDAETCRISQQSIEMRRVLQRLGAEADEIDGENLVKAVPQSPGWTPGV